MGSPKPVPALTVPLTRAEHCPNPWPPQERMVNSGDTGLNLEHCLQLCKQFRKLQVRGCVQEGLTQCLSLGDLSDELQNPEKAQAQLCTTSIHLGKLPHLASP